MEEKRHTSYSLKTYNERYTHRGLLVLPLTPPPSKYSIWDNKTLNWIEFKTNQEFEEEVERRIMSPLNMETDDRSLKDYLSKG